MTIAKNRDIIEDIGDFLEDKLPIKLGVNKKNELTRLIYEISCARNCSFLEIVRLSDIEKLISDGKSGLFHGVKKRLLEIRYPSFDASQKLQIKPVKIGFHEQGAGAWDSNLYPKNIFVEKNTKDLEWTRSFVNKFPQSKIIYIDNAAKSASFLRAKDPVEVYNLRRDNIFLVQAKTAFVKICPCTKNCIRCGYQILNIGFGCPIDCAYCYLQTYSNAPGMVLAANTEDYFDSIKQLDEKVGNPTRIGTGEFTDSLALDKYTEYSKKLIPFFRGMKNLILEFKTKVVDIDNVLNEEPHENIVISWSINTPDIATRYENGAPDVKARINAANLAAKKGYKVGFHFDPMVYYSEWENDYRNIVKELFSHAAIRQNTVWISLGTLRYTPGLKQIAERRFEDMLMFYNGEFFSDLDGKLRYPKVLRIEMYNKMVDWIRAFNASCWVYLCMEPKDVWEDTKLKRQRY